MNLVYTREQLQSLNRTQLWNVCRERGLKCYPKTADCVEAILSKQLESVEKISVAEVKVDEQTEEITTVEINFYDHEVYAHDQQIASITHDSDDFQTQRWVVMVGETEVHRANSWAKCFEYVRWHYKQGTLPVYKPTQTQELVVANPVKVDQTEVVETSAAVTTAQKRNINFTPNSEIAICPDCDGVGCAKCGYSGGLSVELCVPTKSYRMSYFSRINNQAAYIAKNGNTPIGMLFQTRNREEFWENETTSYYWQCGNDRKYWSLADAFSALEELTMPSQTDDELLDKPFDELTREEWERLKQYEPYFVAELIAA